ncbi:MAG: J domain-containing protein [Rhizobiaceae bacterium]|nr:J domain-containing protein [Rhizobiaceae bacterium]
MDHKSKYFDKIRINKGRKKETLPNDGICQWNGCEDPGAHKAPLGRDREGQYLMFCIKHVREYNKSYNYFSGLDDDAIAKFQKDSLTGNRPTWAMGVNRKGDMPSEGSDAVKGIRSSARMRAKMAKAGLSHVSPRHRKLKALEKKAIEALDLPHSASEDQIKARYKELVKLLHPDANGGDRSSEDKLQQIIHSYKYLKQAGFC